LQREPGEGGGCGRGAALQRAAEAGPGCFPASQVASSRAWRRPADERTASVEPTNRPSKRSSTCRAGSGSAAAPSPRSPRKKNPRTWDTRPGCRFPPTVQAAPPHPRERSPTASRAGLLAPDPLLAAPSHPFRGQWRIRLSSPVTAAGPRRFLTVFPIMASRPLANLGWSIDAGITIVKGRPTGTTCGVGGSTRCRSASGLHAIIVTLPPRPGSS